MNTKMFGFDLVDGKRVSNQAQAAALREAAQIALKEGRPGPAARWLNAQGFHSVHGKPFSTVALSGKGKRGCGLFRNRALIGETTIHFEGEQEPVIVYHEPILDKITFGQLQAMLESLCTNPERSLRGSPSSVSACRSLRAVANRSSAAWALSSSSWTRRNSSVSRLSCCFTFGLNDWRRLSSSDTSLTSLCRYLPSFSSCSRYSRTC